jgi:HSP20 family protein
MLIFRNDPFFNLVDTFFEGTKNKSTNGYVSTYRTEDENEYKVEFVVPGLTKKDITVLLDEDLLKVSYEKPEDSTNTFIDSFERTYTLPENINEKKIDAKVENGILTIRLPKLQKKSTQREISIT